MGINLSLFISIIHYNTLLTQLTNVFRSRFVDLSILFGSLYNNFAGEVAIVITVLSLLPAFGVLYSLLPG